MPVYRDADPAIKSMQGIHLYHYFLSNCSQRVCIALEEKGLVGDRFTYADIAWFVQYFLNDRTGVADFRNYPNIRRWGAQVKQRPSFQRGVTGIQP